MQFDWNVTSLLVGFPPAPLHQLKYCWILLKFYWNFTGILLSSLVGFHLPQLNSCWNFTEVWLKCCFSLWWFAPTASPASPLCSTTPIINSTAWVQCALCSVNWNMPVQYVPKCAKMCRNVPLCTVQMCIAVRQCALLSVLQFYFMLCLWWVLLCTVYLLLAGMRLGFIWGMHLCQDISSFPKIAVFNRYTIYPEYIYVMILSVEISRYLTLYLTNISTTFNLLFVLTTPVLKPNPSSTLLTIN